MQDRYPFGLHRGRRKGLASRFFAPARADRFEFSDRRGKILSYQVHPLIAMIDKYEEEL